VNFLDWVNGKAGLDRSGCFLSFLFFGVCGKVGLSQPRICGGGKSGNHWKYDIEPTTVRFGTRLGGIVTATFAGHRHYKHTAGHRQ
jgi:hypothetical protein